MKGIPFYMVTVVAILAAGASQASATLVTIDFEAMGHLQSASAYLAGFGVTYTAEADTDLFVLDETQVYGGGVVDAPSGSKYMHQTGTAPGVFPPNTFTLMFDKPLVSFGFSDAAVLVPSITSPWTAMAFDVHDNLLDAAAFPGAATHATLNFTLHGPGIKSVVFHQTASFNAAFYAGNFDDLVLETIATPEPATATLALLAALPLTLRRRRQAA